MRANGGLFGTQLGKHLMEQNMTLRELSRKTGLDASNLSKLERGLVAPPKKKETLNKIYEALRLNVLEVKEMNDYATLGNKMLPEGTEDIVNNKAIPLLLRAINNQKLTYEQTLRLAELVESDNKWQGEVFE